MSDPAWLADAREMRARKTGYGTIAKRLGLSQQQVYYWLKVKPEPPRWEKTCPGCGVVFRAREARARYCSQSCGRTAAALSPSAQAKRSASLASRNAGTENPNFKHGGCVGMCDRAGERRWYAALGRRCAVAGCATPTHQLALHHAIYRQEIVRSGGDVWDPRNSVTLCNSCHSSHHHRGRVLPLYLLPDSVFEFASEVLGPGRAYEYLRRRYAGDDPRLLDLLDELVEGSVRYTGKAGA